MIQEPNHVKVTPAQMQAINPYLMSILIRFLNAELLKKQQQTIKILTIKNLAHISKYNKYLVASKELDI